VTPAKKRTIAFLVAAHPGGIKRALSEGDKRPAFLALLGASLPAREGICTPYDVRVRLYYSGKASDRPVRRTDRHGDSRDRMALFMVSGNCQPPGCWRIRGMMPHAPARGAWPGSAPYSDARE
jgi:hypothetical protein